MSVTLAVERALSLTAPFEHPNLANLPELPRNQSSHDASCPSKYHLVVSGICWHPIVSTASCAWVARSTHRRSTYSHAHADMPGEASAAHPNTRAALTTRAEHFDIAQLILCACHPLRHGRVACGPA